jgi:hypothetical protein
MMKQRVGQRTTDALVKQHEHGRDLGPFVGEAIAVALAFPLEEAVGFEFAQVIIVDPKNWTVG